MRCSNSEAVECRILPMTHYFTFNCSAVMTKVQYATPDYIEGYSYSIPSGLFKAKLVNSFTVKYTTLHEQNEKHNLQYHLRLQLSTRFPHPLWQGVINPNLVASDGENAPIIAAFSHCFIDYGYCLGRFFK